MNDDKKKPDDDTSGKAALARGEAAITAQEKLEEKEKGPEKAREKEKEDAEKWREEG
jgi:hypothetical protein